jgi:hypothetical protein
MGITQIMNDYSNGLITRGEAHSSLVALGVDIGTAGTLLSDPAEAVTGILNAMNAAGRHAKKLASDQRCSAGERAEADQLIEDVRDLYSRSLV